MALPQRLWRRDDVEDDRDDRDDREEPVECWVGKLSRGGIREGSTGRPPSSSSSSSQCFLHFFHIDWQPSVRHRGINQK